MAGTAGGTIIARAKPREIRLEAVVTRCGCGDPAAHAGRICPKPRAIENRGTVSYWHRNPLRRLWWKLTGRTA